MQLNFFLKFPLWECHSIVKISPSLPADACLFFFFFSAITNIWHIKVILLLVIETITQIQTLYSPSGCAFAYCHHSRQKRNYCMTYMLLSLRRFFPFPCYLMGVWVNIVGGCVNGVPTYMQSPLGSDSNWYNIKQ